MKSAYLYLRTSGDDRQDKAGIAVQRTACLAFAKRSGYIIAQEFVDDGVTGKLAMAARPAGKLLIAALLSDGPKTVIAYDSKRLGRTQPTFWAFIGLCRDSGISVLDSAGTDLAESIMGGVSGMLAEMDRNQIVARLAAGKAHWRGTRRVEGRHPYGQHPSHAYDAERTVVERILSLRAKNVSNYRIAQTLNAQGTRTRYGKAFTTRGVINIPFEKATAQSA